MITLGDTVIAMNHNETGFNMLQNANGGGSDIICLPIQHEDMESVTRSANEIKKSRFVAIDLLVNNAGLAYSMEWLLGGESNEIETRMRSGTMKLR